MTRQAAIAAFLTALAVAVVVLIAVGLKRRAVENFRASQKGMHRYLRSLEHLNSEEGRSQLVREMRQLFELRAVLADEAPREGP